MPLVVDEEMLEAARAALPELPAARAERFERELGLKSGSARDLAFRGELGDYFERALAAGNGVDPVELANWIPQLVERIGSDADPADSNVTPEALATLATMVSSRSSAAGTRARSLRTSSQTAATRVRSSRPRASGR